MFRFHSLAVLPLGLLLPDVDAVGADAGQLHVERVVDVAPVWSGHPVRFALLTRGQRQFVAFYDARRQMTVGARAVNSDKWQLVRLPSRVGWDSHNSVTMAIDDDGQIHLSGNMHCVPLIYFRTQRPGPPPQRAAQRRPQARILPARHGRPHRLRPRPDRPAGRPLHPPLGDAPLEPRPPPARRSAGAEHAEGP